MSAGTAVIKAVAKSGGKTGAEQASAKSAGRLARALGERRISADHAHISQRSGSFQPGAKPQYFHPGTAEWRTDHNARPQVTYVAHDPSIAGRTVHAHAATYEGPGRIRSVGVVRSADINVKGYATKNSAGITHNRYNKKRLKGRETTWNLRPSWMGNWESINGSKKITRHIGTDAYSVRQREWKPFSGVNAGFGAYVGLIGLAAALEADQHGVGNKISHQAYYQRHTKSGKTQRVKNPNYMRRLSN